MAVLGGPQWRDISVNTKKRLEQWMLIGMRLAEEDPESMDVLAEHAIELLDEYPSDRKPASPTSYSHVTRRPRGHRSDS